MSIQPPHTASQKTYLIYAWVGALAGLALALQLPPSFQHILTLASWPVKGPYLMIALCFFAVLLRRTSKEKVICGLCVLLGVISTSITVLLVT